MHRSKRSQKPHPELEFQFRIEPEGVVGAIIADSALLTTCHLIASRRTKHENHSHRAIPRRLWFVSKFAE